MHFSVLLTDDASRDLQDIYDYIYLHDGRSKANRILNLKFAHSFFHRLFCIHGGVEDSGDFYLTPPFNIIGNVMSNWKGP